MFTGNTKRESDKKTNSITLENGSTITIPLTWEKHHTDQFIEMVTPEGDLSVYFLTLPLGDDIQKVIIEAWKHIHPTFNLNPHYSNPPAQDAWDDVCQAHYEAPISESRIVLAIARTFKNHAYICLIDGKMAGFYRRSSEFSMMLESWKPSGFKKTVLTDVVAKQWTEADKREFDTFVYKAMHDCQVPGTSIGIIHQDGTMLYSKAFGVKQKDTNDQVTIDTCFMIGSNTKSLTTFATAMLNDAGKLTWETPITTLLPNFKLADPDLTRRLQIRHTYSASTGMPSRSHFIFKYKGITAEERLADMKDLMPTTQFGETFQYSNELFMVGGYAAARAHMPTGNLEDAYEAMMQHLVFDKLHMPNTFIKPQQSKMTNAAMPHSDDFNGNLCEISLDLEEMVYSLAPAGAIWSTVGDLSRYLLVEMNCGMLEGKRVISEASLLERRKPGINMGENIFYGLGLISQDEQGLTIVSHGGMTLGFTSDLFFIPEKNIGMVVLTNTRSANLFLQAIRQKFLELTFGAKPKADELLKFAVDVTNHQVELLKNTISLKPSDFDELNCLLGDYDSDTFGAMRFSKTNDQYVMEFHSGKSQVGIETDSTGNQFLALISPPWNGSLKFQINAGKDKLTLDLGQEIYCFTKTVHSPSDLKKG